MRFSWAIVSELSIMLESARGFAVFRWLVVAVFPDVALFRFLLLIEDSNISLASIAWSRKRAAPSLPPY